MRKRYLVVFWLLPIILLTFMMQGCTIKGTTDSTADTTKNTTVSTSGKSWFTPEGIVKNDQEIIAYATINLENLKEDMARGRGEYLTSLGVLLGMPAADHSEFARFIRDHYRQLVLSAEVQPEAIIATLSRELVPPQQH